MTDQVKLEEALKPMRLVLNLRRRAQLGRLAGFYWDELPETVKSALFGIAGELEEVADYIEGLKKKKNDLPE
jgi:hypothetical protein